MLRNALLLLAAWLLPVGLPADHPFHVAIASAAPAGMGSAPAILAADIGHHETVTRLVVALSERVPYDVFTLSNPARVVVDLPAFRWQVAPDAEPRPAGVIDGIRHARYKPDVSRLVIDCREPVVVRGSGLTADRSGRYRLFIDLAASRRTSGPGRASGSELSATTLLDGGVIGQTGLASGDGPPPAAGGTAGSRKGTIGQTAMAGTGNTRHPVPRARPPSSGDRSAASRWVVAIDPGHGGTDPGAISASGMYEKQITLATARAVRDQLVALKRYKVVMTRNRDEFIKLRDRIAIARAAGANLFVSLHADKSENSTIRGLSVYTLSEQASDAEAAALAEKENKADLLAGVNLRAETPEVTNILIDLVQRETMNQSSVLAAALVRELGEATLLLPKTHRFAGFAVLKAPDVPSVLLELGYLSSPADERLLRSDQHRRKLASAIARAIDSYFVRVEARNRQ